MAYDRDYPDSWNRDDDFGRNYRTGPSSLSSAREYYGARDSGRGDHDDRNFRGGGTGYGGRDHRPGNDWGRESHGGNRDYYGGDRSRQQGYGAGRSGQGRYGGQYGQYGQSERGRQDWDRQDWGRQDRDHGAGVTGGYYGSDGRRFAQGDGNRQQDNRDYGRQPQGYDYDDRGFLARAGDEVRSWFGDEDAERRREYDQRYDERYGYGDNREYGNQSASSYGHDSDYSSWRRTQVDALDRDYHEYRQENAKKFENDFGNWRTNRQTQRASLSSVNEHMDVVGSDGEHVGTVDKVRGDRIILTKNDADAGGRHHSIPSSWLQSVDDKVTISRTAADAKKQWRDEERSGAFFDTDRQSNASSSSSTDRDGKTDLNKSFSGTY